MLRPTKVRQYLAMMRSRGFDAKAVLAGSGIRESELMVPTTFLDLEQCEKVISNIIELTGNPNIGFEFGRDCQFTDLGIVGYAMASSSTLRQAIDLFFGYANSATGLPVKFVTFENEDGSWGATGHAVRAGEQLLRFHFEEVIGMGVSLTPILTGRPFVIREVQFAMASRASDAPLHGMLKCPVVFEARHNRTLVSDPPLDTPLRGNDNGINDLCLLHCNQIMRRSGRIGTTSSLVRSVLLKSRTALSLVDVAGQLNTSSRTLRRRLQAEGTAFQVLLDEFRSDLAKEYLDTRLIPVKEIARRLGFSRSDAFRRAFKSWNAQTVREYRSSRSSKAAAAAQQHGA